MPYSEKMDVFENLLFNKNIHHNEGELGIENLNKLSKMIGYSSTQFKYGSSFEMFLQDNPGCIQAIHEWMAENFNKEQLKNLGYIDKNEDTEDEDNDA